MHKNTESELDNYCEFLDNWDKLTEQERRYTKMYDIVVYKKISDNVVEKHIDGKDERINYAISYATAMYLQNDTVCVAVVDENGVVVAQCVKEPFCVPIETLNTGVEFTEESQSRIHVRGSIPMF